jgi:hypothetical protein
LMPKSRIKITVLVVIFLVVYWFLGVFYDQILIASAMLTAIACNDMRTRFNVSAEILNTFSEQAYGPDSSTSSGRKIEARRNVARWYLDDRKPGQSRFLTQTSAKEGFSIVGSAVAFGFAAFGRFTRENFDFEAYSILVVTQIVNEVITVWWRIERFRRLLKIDRRPEQLIHQDC